MLAILFQVGVGFGGFQQMLQNMTNLGFFQFVFPFLLALAIFYGVLKFGVGDKIPNSAVGLISLILGFFVMLFASANPGIVQFLENISGTGLIVATGILFLIILLGLTGFKIENIIGEGQSGKIVIGLVILAILVILFFGAGSSFLLPGVVIGSDFWTIIFFVVILIIVLWFLGKDGGGSKAGGGGGPHH